MHSPSFSVAGMTSSSSSHHNHGPNTWGGTSTGHGPSLTTSLSDNLTQSRSHYQPGYMMSATQGSTMQQGSQRMDEMPVVPTKAKMNHTLSRGSVPDFGMGSMFESSRKRSALPDEDAPPMNSINDIPTEVYPDARPFRPQSSNLSTSHLRRQSHGPSAPPPSQQPLYIIVFGYPPDKYSVTVEYFKSLGEATEPDQNTEILNCFRIGYKEPGDAMRAVRKSGEVLGGAWMVGAKWADPAQAEAVIGQSLSRGPIGSAYQGDAGASSNGMVLDETASPVRNQMNPTTPSIGTPIKLAPSTSAFRKQGTGEKGTPQRNQGLVPPLPGGGTPLAPSPSKGVLGQVSDLIFGW